MNQLIVLLVAVMIDSVPASILAREGFKVERKEWTCVMNKPLEDAKELILAEMPSTRFVVHPSDLYEMIPEEGYTNKVMLGVSADGTVAQPAKYFGYVPDLEFARALIGQAYLEAIEVIKNRLPSCQIVVVQDDKVIHTCCENRYMDHLKLEVDEDGLVLELPAYVVTA